MPPSLVVVSRMRKLLLKRGREGGFGVTFRGNRPVFIRLVDFDSHAHSAGLRSGDLLVQLNGNNVRYVYGLYIQPYQINHEESVEHLIKGALRTSSQ